MRPRTGGGNFLLGMALGAALAGTVRLVWYWLQYMSFR